MKRRNFLGTTFLSTLSGLVLPSVLSANEVDNTDSFISANVKIVYAVEAGTFGIDDKFVLGFLVLDESSDSSFVSRVNHDRLGFSYYSELTYFSNDLYKESFAKSLMSYFATAQNTYFQAIVIEKDTIWTNRPGFLTISHNEKDKEKLKYYQRLATAMNLTETSRFIMKSPAPYGLSPAYKKSFNEQVSNAGMDVVNPLTNSVLQFASFLAGTVRSEILKKTSSPIKLGLNEYLKQQLAISSLGVGAIKEGKFKVIAA